MSFTDQFATQQLDVASAELAAPLKDEERILKLTVARVAAGSSDTTPLSVLEAAAEASGRMRQLGVAYSRVLKSALVQGLDVDQQLDLYLRAARVYARQSPARGLNSGLISIAQQLLGRGQARQALPVYEGLLDEASLDSGLLEVIEQLSESAEDVEVLERVHERRVSLASRSLDRARALEKLGAFFLDWRSDTVRGAQALGAAAEIYAAHAETKGHAQRIYESLLAASPHDAATARRLLELYAGAGVWARLMDPLGALISDDIEQAIDLVLGLERRAARASAIDEFVGLVDELLWNVDSAHTARVHELMLAKIRICTLAGRLVDAAASYQALLETHAEERDARAFRALIEHATPEFRKVHLRWLFQWRADRASDPEAVLAEWAKVEESDFGDAKAAVAVLERAAAMTTNRRDICEALSRLKLREGDVMGSLAAMDRADTISDDPTYRFAHCQEALQRELYPEEAEAVAQRLLLGLDAEEQDPKHTRKLLERALELSPGARWLLDRVKLWLSAERRWTRLFGAYENAIPALLDDNERAALLEEAAAVASDSAGEPERGIQYLEYCLLLCPNHPRVRIALEYLYEHIGDWQQLARSLAERADQSTGEERLSLCERAASIWLDVGDASAALPLIEVLPSDDSGNGTFEWLLERLLARDSCSEQSPLSSEQLLVMRRAARLLKLQYVAVGRSADVARVLKIELSYTPKPRENALLLFELGRVHEEELGNLAVAAELYARIGNEAPDAGLRLQALRKLANLPVGSAGERCTVLERLAELENGADRQCALHGSARIAAEELADLQRTKCIYQKLCAEFPRDRAAHDGLIAALKQSGDFAELATVLTSRAKASEDANDACRDKLAAARICLTELGDDERGLELWLEAREQLGPNLQSFVELCKTPESAETILRNKLGKYARTYPRQRRLIHLELAHYLASFARMSEAYGELVNAVQAYPTEPDVLLAFARAATERLEFNAAEQNCRTALILLSSSDAPQDPARAEIYVELFHIKMQAGHASRADQFIEAAFEAAQESERETLALEKALRQRGYLALLGRALSERLCQTENALDRARLLRDLIELWPVREAPVHLRVLCQGVALGLEDSATLFDERGTEILDCLLSAYERLGQTDRELKLIEDLYVRGIELAQTPETRRSAALGLAHACNRAGCGASALPWLERLASEDLAGSSELRCELRSLYSRIGNHRKEAAVLLAQVSDEPEPRGKVALLIGAAKLLVSEGEPDAALDALIEARAIDPSCIESVLLRARILAQQGFRDEALELLRAIACEPDETRRTFGRVRRLIAELLLADDALVEAYVELVEAHRLDRSDPETALMLGLVAIDVDRLSVAASALRSVIAKADNTSNGVVPKSEIVSKAYFHLACLARNRSMRTDARRMLARAVDADPNNGEARRLMVAFSA